MSLIQVSLNDIPQAATQGWENVRNKLISSLKEQETSISGSIRNSVDDSSALMSLPEHLRSEFRRLDAMAQSPEQQKYVAEVKRNVLALHEARAANIREKVSMNISKMNFEFAMKAISKSVSAIQQVLSSQ
ncbi:hypothetical protein [Ochrobactrum sp. Marseille-Q0166]|uniref:hypothetical protein n=1 Tax=Ochrobactrum sp. Marseille-Q0166 TaxID=2761105 RepID=UPI001655FB7E|nr:hypothetical protein [Ochrobactrum sp. Marseille-Q0166]MBC8719590.1 hypothetical protein [Ochrobactrum sp. Marseille-Q0166]